ncbi:YraN family protein [Chitinophaga sedimenti]|uniref:YraN family protein n=1 Tax=Chitinophaga sedimenti TaxID=2033606 RepID=UPI0020039C05|nr:YraN family protein [Chitinophaga sedimenti]MCK7555091.1 YraN family protein [Chitinophaga sedimenti]
MASHHELGKKGEEMAAAFLRGAGHIILHTNWRSGKMEIDIVSRHGQLIIFTEVKTRSNSLYGWPEEAVSAHKQQVLERAAARYLEQMNGGADDIRFDIIAITFGEKHQYDITHLVDVFS